MVPKSLVNIRSTGYQRTTHKLPLGGLPQKFWSRNDQKLNFFQQLSNFCCYMEAVSGPAWVDFTHLKWFVRQERTLRGNRETRED